MDNTALLTRGNAIYSEKRAKKRARPEELNFDPNKRLEFLTGFHQRKTERQKKAAEYLKEQERKERIETRKEIREARKADIEERLKSVNATIEASGSDDDEKTALEEPEIKIHKDSIWENHFEDAEKLTTVTVIEDFEQPGLETAEELPKPTKLITPKDQAGEGGKSSGRKEKSHPETKKKKFRYGTKNERQAERKKAKLKKQKHSAKRK